MILIIGQSESLALQGVADQDEATHQQPRENQRDDFEAALQKRPNWRAESPDEEPHEKEARAAA